MSSPAGAASTQPNLNPNPKPPVALAIPSSARELFVAFTWLALQGFGGVLPIAQREVVDRRRWLTREDFLELLSVGQVLPGPNVVNLALMIGDRFFGWRGALAAMTGMLLAPLILVLLLAVLYGAFASNPVVAGALRGMGAVAAGLIAAMAFKLLPALRKNPGGVLVCGAVALLCFGLIGVLRWPLAAVVIGIGAMSIAWSWWRIGQASQAVERGSGEVDHAAPASAAASAAMSAGASPAKPREGAP